MSTALLGKTAQVPMLPYKNGSKGSQYMSNRYFEMIEKQYQYELYLPIPHRVKNLTHLEVKDGIVKIIARINFSVVEDDQDKPFMRQTYQYHLNADEGSFSLRYRSEHMIKDGYFFNSFYHHRAIPDNLNVKVMQIHYGEHHLKLILPKAAYG